MVLRRLTISLFTFHECLSNGKLSFWKLLLDIQLAHQQNCPYSVWKEQPPLGPLRLESSLLE